MATTPDKGTPIGLTDSVSSDLLDKGTPIGIKDDSSENAEPAQEDADETAQDSE
jgi:hypothetical protein